MSPHADTPLVKTAHPECVWPALPSPKSAELLAQLFQLEHTQWLSPSVMIERQMLQLRHLTSYAYRESPYVKQRLDECGLSAGESWSLEKLARVALLTRQALVEHAANIHSRAIPLSHLPSQTVQTSGSTGQIVKLRRTALNSQMWMALTMRDHFWHRRDFSQVGASIRANTQPQDDDALAAKEGWGIPVTLLFETGAGYRQPLSLAVDKQAAWLLHRNPGHLLTYPTNLNALLDEFERMDKFPSRLREARTIGESLSADLRTRCERQFGIKTVDIYSAQEVGVIALQCPVSGLYHVQSESLIVEVLSVDDTPCGEGEIGRVVITDLHNFATPILRYEIRDYAEVGASCPCGRGLPTLKRILGRRRNMVTLPDGSRHWPMVGFASFRAIAPIRQYQAVQLSLDTVEMRLVVDAPLTPVQEKALREVVVEALGYPFALRFVYRQGELPKTRGGKFEEFMSMV